MTRGTKQGPSLSGKIGLEIILGIATNNMNVHYLQPGPIYKWLKQEGISPQGPKLHRRDRLIVSGGPPVDLNGRHDNAISLVNLETAASRKMFVGWSPSR